MMLGSKALVAFLGVPRGSLRLFIPLADTRVGHRFFWTIPTALGLRVGRMLRAAGLAVSEAERAVHAIRSLNPEQIEAMIADGRTRLPYLGGLLVLPRLVRPGEVEGCRIDGRPDLTPASIDVLAQLVRLRAFLRQHLEANSNA